MPGQFMFFAHPESHPQEVSCSEEGWNLCWVAQILPWFILTVN